MSAIDVEVQVGTAPQVDAQVQFGDAPAVDVTVQLDDPTFTVVAVLPTGPRGPAGTSIPSGGDAGQILAKASDTDGDAEWVDPTAGIGAVDSVNGEVGVVVLSATDVGADPSGTATLAVGAHVAASDPHPQYLTPAEGNAAYDATGAAAAASSSAASALAAHEADTTNIHGIADTAVLETTTGAATKVAAEAALARNADNLTSGTVADARVASTIARDSEVTAAVAAEAALARNADNLSSGTVPDARIPSAIARDSEVTAAVAAEATLARNADNLTSGTVADARIASTIARDSEVTSAVAGEAVARDSAIAAAIVGSTAAEFARDTIAAALVAGARISVSVSDPGDTITLAVTGLQTSDLSDFATAVDERARDALGTALTAGANIAITADDTANTITIAVTGLTSSSLSDFTEAVQDVVGAFLAAGTGITATYNDAGNVETVAIDTAVTVDKTTAQTLTNKTLTSPAITTPTGIVKGDVGLGNVDNTADSAKAFSGAQITSGTVTDARIDSAIARDSEVAAGYQPLDSDLTAIAALSTTSYGRALLALADAAAGRTAFGLGTAATAATGDFDAAGAAAAAQAASQPLDSDLTAIAALTTTSFGRSLLAAADAAALRVLAGAVIGTNVQAWDADLDAIAALATTSFGRSVLTQADAAALRSLAGLVIGTNVQAFDADLTTYAGITPGALGQAILPMTTLTNKGIVLGRGASAPAALAPDSGTTKFLKNSVASDDPTWQTIAESDVTNLVADFSAANTQVALLAAREEVRRIADTGYFVCSGLALSVSGTAGKLDMAAGVQFIATTELNAAAQTAITPGAGAAKDTIAELADATNPKWVVIELDSSNVVQYNEGTAAASPVLPTITTTRVILGFLYVPANATTVSLPSSGATDAKLIDCRNLRSVHLARLIAKDTSATPLTNPTALTSNLAAVFSIPANSLNVGDVIIFDVATKYINTQNASTIQVQILVNAGGHLSRVTASLATGSLGHNVLARLVMQVLTIGASGTIATSTWSRVSEVLNTSGVDVDAATGGVAGTIDTTAAITIDFKVKVTTSSSTSTFTLQHAALQKLPA